VQNASAGWSCSLPARLTGAVAGEIAASRRRTGPALPRGGRLQGISPVSVSVLRATPIPRSGGGISPALLNTLQSYPPELGRLKYIQPMPLSVPQNPGCRTATLSRCRTVSCLWSALVVSVCGSNWPGWRGPDGSGLAAEKSLPLHWATNQNVAWRVELPDRGNSTPVVWGRRIFLTQAINVQSRRTVMCFDRRNGRLLWQSGVTWTEKEPTNDQNPPCTPSPATDRRRVIAWFGSAGVYCYDPAGRELWHRDLGRQRHQWGYAASLVLYHGLCFLNFGPGDRSFVIALDKKTGRIVWKSEIPIIGSDVNRQELGGPDPRVGEAASVKLSEIAGSWATPLIVPATGHDELVIALPLRLVALAPGTGQELWHCGGPNIGAYSSPFHGEDLVGYAGGGFRNTLMLVRPGGRGDVTNTRRLWLRTLANSQSHLGAGVIFQGHIYLVNTAGIAECFELESGQTIWTERLPGTGGSGGSWSSPVRAGDRLYVPNRNADVFVLKAAPKFELLAINSISGEPMSASLAVSDGDIFIRTDKSLWCIGPRRK
jgi:outer membrane protein assembly factor BamB